MEVNLKLSGNIKRVYIYDLEIFPNFFSATFKSLEGKVRQFVLFENRNEISELKSFIKENVSGLIGYNNINYDNPLLEFILKSDDICSVHSIYDKSQEIINAKFSAVRNPLIPQLDLFRIWHFDNITKAVSLKYIECAIRFDNVEDLPFSYDYIVGLEDVQTILDYNLNDVNATEKFYYITLGQHDGRYNRDNKIQLRKDIQKEFGINCLNYNDVKIGEEINKQYYLKKTGKSWWELKQLETIREIIYIKNLIPSYIEFKTKELQTFLSDISLCSFKIDEKFKRKFEFAGLKIEFKKGGLHAISKDKLIIPKDNEILCEQDVMSMYPATIINQKIYPEHLGLEFLDIYKKVFDLRLSAKKSGNKTIAAALKLSLNGGGFGKMGAKKSWMKDELAMYKVTFCGQLSLLLLIEYYYLADIKVINANTDSITILFNRDKQDIIEKINKEWQEITNYQLEQTVYTKLIQRDINNYLAIVGE